MHDEDEVLHNFVGSMYTCEFSLDTFGTVYSAKVCLVLYKIIVFEQALFKCASFVVAF